MTKFQVIVLAVFVGFLIAGVIAFAMYKGGGSSGSKLPSLTIWGTFPSDVFEQYVSNINNTSATAITVTYKQDDPSAFSQDFIAALARGDGPDAILIPADMLLPHEDKLALIPYTTLPERTFLDSYIQEAQIYTTSSGILALPFSVDPLVMYWNRDMFNTAGIATYPHYWSDFDSLAQKLTVRDQNGNITQSAVALGDFTNVDNAREILASMMFQLGNQITAYNAQGVLQTTFKSTADVSPEPAIDFFSQFVDPTSDDYSWDRSMSDSKTEFLSGELATYFGYSSEISDIRSKNPNLNFDVAPLPQIKSGGVKSDYARMFGLSLVRTTPDPTGAYQVLSILTNPTYLAGLATTMYMPSVLTSAIAQGSTDPYITVFNQAALVGQTWLDPDPAISTQIFGNVIESITTGQKSASQAIEDGGLQYDSAIQQATSQ
jgi:ABC-type glycerol-3-phosphate transport system substrate-binding protein